MFKNIFSKVQAFGKAVISKITAFVGGIIGIKPVVVEIPAPPEVSGEQANTNTEAQTEEKEEGLMKKAFDATKKVVEQSLIVSAQIAYMVAHFTAPFYICAWAWEYAQAQGLIALLVGMWQMGTLPYMILCILIAIGIGSLIISVEALWSALLQPIRRFLFPVKQQAQPAKQPVEQKKESITTNEAITIISTVVAQQFSQEIKSVSDRLTNLEKAIATPTPTINLEKEEIVVDSSPAITLEPVVSEVIPTVIEIEEVVDSSPTPTRKDELMEQKISELKTTIRELNKALPAPKRISSRGEKIALVARIIKAEAEVA